MARLEQGRLLAQVTTNLPNYTNANLGLLERSVHARSFENAREYSSAMGMNASIAKPLRAEALTQVVNSTLQKYNAARQGPTDAGHYGLAQMAIESPLLEPQ